MLEYCGARHRTVPLVALMVSYSLASVLTPLAASLLPHWIYLTVPVSALTLPVLILSRWLHLHLTVVLYLYLSSTRYIPESLSWLESQGRREEAMKAIHKVGKINGRRLATFMEIPHEAESAKASADVDSSACITDLFRMRNVRRHTVFIIIVW